MTIEIYKGDDLITSFQSESNPFKIGETINISVSNYDTQYWNAKEVKGIFKIEQIEHFLRTNYSSNKSYNSILITNVKVSEL